MFDSFLLLLKLAQILLFETAHLLLDDVLLLLLVSEVFDIILLKLDLFLKLLMLFITFYLNHKLAHLMCLLL